MLATSSGGKLRGEDTGACATGTSSVVSNAATRGDIGVPTSGDMRVESGMLSLNGRDLGGSGCACATTCAGEPFGCVVCGKAKSGGPSGNVAEDTPAQACPLGAGMSTVSGLGTVAEEAAPLGRKSDAPGTGCVAGAACSSASACASGAKPGGGGGGGGSDEMGRAASAACSGGTERGGSLRYPRNSG